MLTASTLKDIIKKKHLLEDKDLSLALRAAKKKDQPLETYLTDNNLIAEDALYHAAASFFQVPFIDLRGREIKKEVVFIIPNPLALARQAVVFAQDANEIKIAALDPNDLEIVEFIKRKTGKEVKIYLTTPTSLKEALHKYHITVESELTVLPGEETGTDEKTLKKLAEDLPVINIVNNMLEQAVFEEASDIHIEPEEKRVAVRYRVDGILRPATFLPKNIQYGIIARVKILANLKLDEHMLPQDGRIKIVIQNVKYSLRVSVLPVYDGEKVVMRLLKEETKALTLAELGFLEDDLRVVERNLAKPFGMILATGPTGSGKTTTLYAVLNILNKPGVNISTIEDPIEYRVPGINQSQINPRVGYTFAVGLRAFLRQDPDIIMVGEIRDNETALISLHAALTGHLVLSTLHTNDAPSTLPRLLDMGVPSFMIAYTANIIIAQRLVRRLCAFCKKEYFLNPEDLARLTGQVTNLPKLISLFKKYGHLPDGSNKLDKVPFYRGDGCNRCHKEGYKGRVGVYEVLEVDKEMAELLNQQNSMEEIKKLAQKKGMNTMLEDGLIKARLGLTSLEEILEATKE